MCAFWKDNVNEEQLHKKIRQFLASNNLNNPTPNAFLKLLTENQTLTNWFLSLMCLLRVYFASPCTTCEADSAFSALRHIKYDLDRPRLNVGWILIH